MRAQNTHREALVTELKESGVLTTPRIEAAFRAIDRADFVPDAYQADAYENYPLPIVGDQTISQPYTVAFMLELLQPQHGDRILDVGAGSGWQTALLAHIVGEEGAVYALEVHPDVKAFGEANVRTYPFIEEGRVRFIAANARDGYADAAPFDRIIAAASMEDVPDAWFRQLAPTGRIVAPVGSDIRAYTKHPNGTYTENIHSGFMFVPFVP